MRTSAAVSGLVRLCIAYDDPDQDGVEDGSAIPLVRLRLLQAVAPTFVDVTTSVGEGVVCGTVPSASAFVVGVGVVATSSTTISGGGTTTTLPLGACGDPVACLDVALAQPLCGDEPVAPKLRKIVAARLGKARSLLRQAGAASDAEVAKRVARARKQLARVGARADASATRKKRPITAECRDAIRAALAQIEAVITALHGALPGLHSGDLLSPRDGSPRRISCVARGRRDRSRAPISATPAEPARRGAAAVGFDRAREARRIGTWLAMLLFSTRAVAAGEENRWYAQFRFGESMPFSRAHDAVGLTVGRDLTEHLGLELAADFYEVFVDQPGIGKVAECGTGTIVPQLRLRHAFLDDRLVAYAIGGVGAALTQLNDRTSDTAGTSISLDDAAFVGTLGAGVEYLVADNVAVGIEGKHLFASTQTLRYGADRRDFDVDASLLALSMRLLFPQLDTTRAAAPGAPGTTTFYVGLRAGFAKPVHRHVFGPVRAEPEAANVGPFDQLYGFAVGAQIGRYLGVELPIEGYEARLELPGFGSLGEYAVYSLVPQARLRYPLLEERLWPYVLGGVGMSFGEFNDPAPGIGRIGFVHGEDSTNLAGILGGGLEWFAASNISLTGEARYLFARGQTLRIGEDTRYGGNFDSLFLTIGLRVYLFGS